MPAFFNSVVRASATGLKRKPLRFSYKKERMPAARLSYREAFAFGAKNGRIGRPSID